MKTSVIITVYNRPDMLKACLRALELNTGKVDEAVISDDGSNEECTTKMKAFFGDFSFPIHYVRQEDSGYRLAAARNNAIRAATGDYLISLDCDIMLLPDAVDVHLRQARRGFFLAGNRAFLDQASSKLALNSPLSADFLNNLWSQSDKSHLPGVSRQFNRNRLLRRFKLARRHKPKLIGCHFSLFKADIEVVNGFDEEYTGWGLEDDDFARRLHSSGAHGESVILQARALHLWHEQVASMPSKLSESPNMALFKRANIPAFCVEGLIKTG